MADVRTHEFHHFYSINGFIEGNGPMMIMRQGERRAGGTYSPTPTRSTPGIFTLFIGTDRQPSQIGSALTCSC